MAFQERGRVDVATLTAASAWDLDTWLTPGTSGDPIRLKNINLLGSYQIDQASEVNSQFGCVAVVLMRFPDTVTTPDPDFVESGISGVDRQIFKWRYIWTGGQNNPVLWTMRFKAVNVNPGQKLVYGIRVMSESGASVNHRVQTASRWWQDDG